MKSSWVISTSALFAAIFWGGAIALQPLRAQSVIPAADGTGTTLTHDNIRFDIEGGTRSADGSNLFHSFEQFGLDEGQTANFLSTPETDNIFTRVVGGNPSLINGLLEVTGGNSNLFLINPAGILFGPSAQLNVPASFFATTANAIGFESGATFDILNDTNYDTLIGTPNQFDFNLSESGRIVNAGDLAVGEGNSLTLMGGIVLNAGTLSAPGGNIAIAAIPGQNRVRLSQEGMVLSLEIEPIPELSTSGLSPMQLPQLLTEGNLGAGHARGASVNADGSITLTGSQLAVPATPGTAIASGEISVASSTGIGGAIDVLGETVGAISAAMDASGSIGGGNIHIGSPFEGNAASLRADRTLVSADSTLLADASDSGNGGRVILWGNNAIGFDGSISARGSGEFDATGGFVEVSGQQSLIFDGMVDVSAANGTVGTLLLKRSNLIISNDTDSEAVANALGEILFDELAGETIPILPETLEKQTANIVLEATSDLEIASDVSLEFLPGGSISFRADADADGDGAFSMSSSQEIRAEGREINISGASVTLGTIDTSSEDDGAAIAIASSNGDILARSLVSASTGSGRAGDIALSAFGKGNIAIGSGAIDASSALGDGAAIALTTEDGNIQVADVTSRSGGEGTGGNIALTIAGTGAIDAHLFALDSSSVLGNGGAIALTTADGDIKISRLNSSGGNGGTGGDISLAAGGLGEITSLPETLDPSLVGDGSDAIAVGKINLNAGTGVVRLQGSANTIDLTVRANAVDVSASPFVTGQGKLVLEPGTAGTDVAIVPLYRDAIGGLKLTQSDLDILSNGFESIAIGRSDGTGTVTLDSNITFDVPVAIVGGSILAGPDRNTRWNITGTNRGTLNGYPNGLSFENIETLRGGNGNDRFAFSDGASISGRINGQSGSDTLDYSAYTREVTVNFPQNTATGTGRVFNIENFIPPNLTSQPQPEPEPEPEPQPQPSPEPQPQPSPSPQPSPEPQPQPSPSPQPQPSPSPQPQPNVQNGGNGSPRQIEPAPDIKPLQPSPTAQSPAPSTAQSASTPETAAPSTEESATTPIRATTSPIAPASTTGSPATATEPATPQPTTSQPAAIQPTTESAAPQPTTTQPRIEPTTTQLAIQPTVTEPTIQPATTQSSATASAGSTATPTPTQIGDRNPIESQTSLNAIAPAEVIVPEIPAEIPSLPETGYALMRSPSDSFDRGNRLNETNASSISTDLNQLPAIRFTNRRDIERQLDDGEIVLAIETSDRFFSEDFENYLGQKSNMPYLSFVEMQTRLEEMATLTGTKSALVYVFVRDQQLDLVLVPPVGEPIYHSVPAAGKAALMQQITTFQQQIADVTQRRTTSYLSASQQLYQWIIAPIEPDLQRFKIKNLIFSLDAGLRTLPIAALHDGQQFLVEKYNMALVPSLHLTDGRYDNWKNTEVLAMGMSEFTDKTPLPAVPIEIETIAKKLWRGEAFLNQSFTLKNLKELRKKEPFGIIHIATHGQFQSGREDSSYIQLWDEKLNLDRMEQLEWNDPPVELLVLSACRTAIGDLEAEFGFAGLAVQAGVKSAIASLWYANDAGTLGLMSEFYQNLRSASIKAEALQRAQIAMIRGEVRLERGKLVGTFGELELPPELSRLRDRELNHPYYWAGFTTIGSPW